MEQAENNPLYQQAFNNGYLIAQYEPELADALSHSPNDNSDYFKGLIAGTRQYEKDKLKEHLFGKEEPQPLKHRDDKMHDERDKY